MSDTSTPTERNLAQWLDYLETIHPSDIEMGLKRVQNVYQTLNLNFADSQVLIVGGTNGKGTTCRLIESFAQHLGKTVGVYSSPHLLDYRERVRVNDQLLSEQLHCDAFQEIESKRGNTQLTYFEFGTLAALKLLSDAELDVVILEVGLGGRLDAVNIVEPDLSVITTVAMDHQDWLGNTREAIGFEKAGILRDLKPGVVGDANPPESLRQVAEQKQSKILWQGHDFWIDSDNAGSVYRTNSGDSMTLVKTPFPKANIGTALTAVAELGWKVTQSGLDLVLNQIKLPGRCQLVQSKPDVLLDVAHNPQATEHLFQEIQKRHWRHLHIVVGMLSDKDSRSSLAPFVDLNAHWHLAPVNSPRSATTDLIRSSLKASQQVTEHCSVKSAYHAAIQDSQPDDLVVVFGSFFTVAEVLEIIKTKSATPKGP